MPQGEEEEAIRVRNNRDNTRSEEEEVLHGRAEVHAAACGAPCDGAGGYGLKELWPMQSPCWSKEKNEEEGEAKSSCYGLTPTPIACPSALLGAGGR